MTSTCTPTNVIRSNRCVSLVTMFLLVQLAVPCSGEEVKRIVSTSQGFQLLETLLPVVDLQDDSGSSILTAHSRISPVRPSTPPMDSQRSSPLWVIGVSLGLLSAFSGALGDNLVRRSFNQKNETCSRNWTLFCIGWFSSIVLNNGLTIASYNFASIVLITPLGGFHILFAVLLAIWLNNEPFKAQDGVSVAVIIIGVVGVIFAGPKKDEELSPIQLYERFQEPIFVGWCCFEAALMLMLAFLAAMLGQKWQRVAMPLMAALCGSFSNLLVKISLSLVVQSSRGTPVFSHHYEPYLIIFGCIVAGCGQLFSLNFSLKNFEAISVVPVMSSTLITTSSIISMVFFKEWSSMEPWQLVMLPVFVIVVVVGIIALSSRERGLGEKKEEILKGAEVAAIPTESTTLLG